MSSRGDRRGVPGWRCGGAGRDASPIGASLWLAVLVTLAAPPALSAQPSPRVPPAPAAPEVVSPLAPRHPLLTALRPPEWLRGRRGLTVTRAPALDARVEAAWSDALRLALVPQLGESVAVDALRFVVTPDAAPAALVAATRAAGHDAGVHLEVAREGQRVLLRAHYVDLRVEPPREHAETASQPLDAFLARLVGGVPVVRADTVRARALRFDATELLGLGAADLDGDLRDELIVARTPHVSVYALESEGERLHLVRLARARWPAAAARVPRVRRVEAWLSVEGGRALLSRSDREGEFALVLEGEELRFEPVASTCAGGRRFPDGCARWVPGRDYFGGELDAAALAPPVTEEAGDDAEHEDDVATGATGARAPRFYARAQRSVFQADGRVLPFVALVTPRGVLVAEAGAQRAAARGQGASLAAADVDADGALDVLTSDYIREGQEDRLRWFRVAPDARLTLVWEGARVPGAVLHAAAGDLLGTGRPLFVAFEGRAQGGSRLWVLR